MSALAQADLADPHRRLAHGRCGRAPRRRADEGAEAGGRDLHDPAAGLQGPQPGRRDLLGLQDRARVARAVRGVQEHDGRRCRRRRAPGRRRTPPTRSSRRAAPSGLSSTAGPVPATRVARAPGSSARRAPRGAPRSGMYSPNGTRCAPCRSGRRACRRAARATCAFRKWSPASSVTPTAIGASRRAASAATSVALVAGGELVDVDDVLGPHDQVDGPGRASCVGGAGGARTPRGDRCRRRACPGARRPARTRSGPCRSGGPRGQRPRPSSSTTAPPASTAAGQPAPAQGRRQRHAEPDGDQRDQQRRPPRRASGARGPAAWPIAEGGEGHALRTGRRSAAPRPA